CLLPIAVCVYSVDAEALFSVGDVEFTQPDVVFIVVGLVVITRAMFKGFHSLQKSFFLPLFFFLLSGIATLHFAAGEAIPTGTFGGHQQFAFYTSFSAAMAFALFVNEKRKNIRSAY